MKQTTTYGLPSRMLAGLLSLCMILTTFIGLGFFPVVHAAAGNTIPDGGKITQGGTYTVNDTYTGCIVIDTSTDSNKDVTIDGNGTINANGNGSAILITGGANVTLKGSVTVTGGTGTWLENTDLELAGRSNVYYTTGGYRFREGAGQSYDVKSTPAAGKYAVYLGKKGDWYQIKLDGEIGWMSKLGLSEGGEKNGRTLVGGGVYVESGSFTLAGGIITGNTAHRGGGIFVNQGASLTMTSGTVSNNSTVDYVSHGANENLAGEGGGIFVYGTALITGGEIKENVCNSTTDLGGGGLYVNNNGKATLHNAIIKANTADGFGGGIAGCCHGAAALISTDGAAVYDNIAKGTSHTLGKHGKNINATSRNNTAEIIDHYKESTGIGIKADNSKDLYNAGSTFVNNYMVGGGSAQYECIYSTKNDQGYLEGKTVTIPDSEVLSFDKTDVGLVAHPTEEAKEDAENERNTNGGVLIEGNTSKVHGGGIGCNGTIVFGSSESHEFKFETLELSLDAAKTFNGAVPTGKKFTFGLYYNEACTQEAARATNGADGTINFSFTGYQQISKKISNKKPVSTSSDGKRTIVVTEGTLAFYLKEIVPSGATSEIYYDQSVYKIDLTIKTTTTTTDEVYKPADDSNNNVNVKVISIEHVGTKKTITKIKDEYGNVLNEEPVSSGIPTFNNTDAGQLIVRKTVTGKGADMSKEFTFTVKFTAPASKTVDYKNTAKLTFDKDTETGYSVNWTGNTLTFTLKDSESVTIDNLPVGTTYKVEETDANQNGYKTSWTNGEPSGAITNDKKSVELTCTNTYNPDDAKFTPKVEKTLTGAEKLKDGQSLTFEFTIEANEGTTLPERYNNKASVTYTGTGSAIDKVQTAPFGAITYDKPGTYTYTIKETTGNDARVNYDGSEWTLTVKVEDNGGKLVATGTYKKGETESNTAAAKFTNTYETGSLKVTKTVTGSAGDKTKDFSFEVTFTAPDGKTAPEWQDVATLTFSDGSEDGHSVKWNGSTLTFTLKHSETLTVEGLPVGTTYTVNEGDYSTDGYTKAETGTRGTIEAATTQNAVVTNDKPGDGEFTPKVEKKLIGPKASTDVTFTFTLTPNGDAPKPETGGDTVTIKGAGSGLFGNIKFTEDGTYTYTITETVDEDSTEFEYDTSKWTLTVTVTEVGETLQATGVYTKDGAETTGASIATFTNTRKTGDLTVSKTVTGNGGDKTKEFNFTVALDDKTINGTFGDMKFTNGVAKFTLKDGESKTAKGLPAGVGYTVTETEANADNYTTKYNGEVGKTNATGTITTAGSTVIVENNRVVGSLKIKKVVDGLSAEEAANKEFKFTVTGPNGYKDENVTVKGNGETTLENLVLGEYTITENETDAQVNGYTLNVTGNKTATVTADEVANATITNTYTPEPEYGLLTVTKSVAGTGADTDKTFDFTVTLDDGTINGTYGDMEFVNGVAEFSLKHGESATATGLPVGIGYTVDEADYSDEGYKTSYSGNVNSGTITTSDTVVNVTNTYTPTPGPATVEVSVSKVWEDTGNEDARPESVTVQLYRDGAAYDTAVTLNGDNSWSHTWTDLPDGHDYTVSETNVPAGYTSEATSVGNRWTITNTYTPTPGPATVDVSVEKVWNDAGNEEARPASVTVQLSQDGAAYGDAVTLSADNSWSHTWTDLPDGHEYTVSETNVPAGYTSSATSVGNIWTITNTYDEPKPVYGSLTITKVVEPNGAPVDGKTYTFTVTGPSYPAGHTVTITGSGETTLTDLVPGEYTIAEADANITGFTWTYSGNVTVAVTAGGTATAQFTNTYEPEPEYGSLTITKSISGGPADIEDKTFSFTVTGPNGSQTVTITGEGSVTLDNLVPGTYTVTEADAGIAGWNWQATGTGTVVVSANAVSTASVTNTYSERTGGLSVSKTVTGSAGELEREFNFTVTLDTAISGTYGGMTFTNGVARFTLSSGESVTATGLPVGTGYTVVEAEANEDGYTTTSTGATGTIAENVTASAVFVNTNDEEYGGLTVTKTVTGTDGEPDRAFNFTVTLDDTTINGTYGGMTFTNGVASFTLSSGESVTASGLPAGTGYTVTEAEANLDGYTTTATGMTGTIAENVTSVALFTNHRDAEVYGALTIRKAVVGGGDAAANRTYTFTVTGPDGYSETVTVTGNGSATLNDLVPGEYTVTEADANIAGQSLETTGTGNVTVTANMTAEAIVTNTYTNRVGGLTVTKTVTGIGDATREFSFTVTLSDTTVNGTYGGMTFVNGIATFTLSHGESVSASGLPADIGYTVTETGANSDGYITSVVGASAGTITADAISAIEFINDMPVVEYGSLSVTKTVTGAGDTTTAFNFTVTLADTTVNGTYGDMTFVNGVAVFTLRHGETATATGLPAGTSYVVSEETEVGYTTSSTGAVGAIPANGTAAAEFVNYMPMPDEGSLTVTKIVSGNASNTADAFTFVITLADATVNGTYGDMTFANGVATVMLRHGETASASGLPAGINYTVTELEANTDNYMTYAVGDTGTIPAGGVAQSVFYNRRNVTYPDNERLGTIVTRKVVSGSEGELDREFHFTLTLTDTTVNGTYGELMFTNGVATFALRNGESVWARDLPTGIGYTVTELEANYDGYETTSVGAIGVIAEDTINEVRFVNHRGDSDEFDEWEDLFDPDIPLSDFPFDDFDDWDIPLSDIDLVSMTGDIGINTGFWMIAMTVSLTGIILTLLTESRKRRYAVAKRRHASRD